MMERYLLKYFFDASESPLMRKWIDYLKVDLDGFIYAYGENMRKDYPAPRDIDWRYYARIIRAFLKSENARKYVACNNNILSFVPLSANIESQFDINLLGSILQPTGKKLIRSKNILRLYDFYSKLIRSNDFNEILTNRNIDKLEIFKNILITEYSKYKFKGLFVGNGEPFMFKLHMDLFRELGIPSFIFLHGLPGIYKLETEKKADYLCVWGEQIKQNYVQAGFEPERVIVTGHKQYNVIPSFDVYKNNLDDVLVTTTSSVSWSPQGWNAENFPLYDRSILVLYCYSVQTVLKKTGVKHARLRVHPSVNKKWIMEFVDKSFYSIDILPLVQSLNQSTLVIGPTTTVWLESFLNGVNYLVYEPELDGLSNNRVPPFDGSDKSLAIAKTEQDLYSMIKEKYIQSNDIIQRYIQPFDFSKVQALLKNG